MSVISILEIQVQPDKVDEAQAILARIIPDTRAFDGCLGVTVAQDSTDPTHFLAVETWESLEHDTAYRKWRAGEGAITDLPGVLAAAPRLTISNAVDV